MKSQLTKIIENHEDWYVGYIREIPGVNTQGRTLSEARRNLEEALSLVIEANRRLSSNPS
jgi:predicted RNase H-like HicB family nuclease